MNSTKDIFPFSVILCSAFFLLILIKSEGFEHNNIFYFRFISLITIVGGSAIGNILRIIAMPDSFLSSGMVDTLKQKLFWAVGPQFFGAMIGWFIIICSFSK